MDLSATPSESAIISPERFFKVWGQVCDQEQKDLVAAWKRGSRDYTTQVLHAENAVLGQVAKELGLKVNSNYYSLDAVFTYKNDRVTCTPANWFQNIRIAFEHENSFSSGLFQEVSHLLITRADLRVLVTYPDTEAKIEPEFEKLAQIISSSDLAKTDPAFLLITGWLSQAGKIEWKAFTFQKNKLLPMNEEADGIGQPLSGQP